MHPQVKKVLLHTCWNRWLGTREAEVPQIYCCHIRMSLVIFDQVPMPMPSLVVSTPYHLMVSSHGVQTLK